MKKIALFLLVILVMSSCLLVLMACKPDTSEEEGKFSFSKKGDNLIVASYMGPTKVIVPNEYEGQPVTGISKTAFSSSGVTEVIITNGIKTIASEVFAECGVLKRVSIPKSVTTIGENVFQACIALTEIEVDSQNPNFISIDGNLYTKDQKKLLAYTLGSSKETFEVPTGVEDIASSIFSHAPYLEKVVIPKTVKNIGDGAFENSAIKEFVTDAGGYFNVIDTVLYADDDTTLFCYPPARDLEEEIYLDSSIKTLHTKAFAYTNIKRMYLNEGLEDINGYAFSHSAIEYISISSTVKRIGQAPFSECVALKNISVHENNAFFQDVNDCLYNKDSTKLISYAMAKKDNSFIVPKGVIEIAHNAFWKVQYLEEIEIPDTVTTIGDYAFSGDDLVKFLFHSTNPPTIHEKTFVVSQRIDIYVPDGYVAVYQKHSNAWEIFEDFVMEWSER